MSDELLVDEDFAPTVEEIVNHDQYKWIFVGGKGGVGKTTTSCCLSLLLAQKRDSVLIISTDPAHNLSDAFNQKIGSKPTPINGIPNLSAMEVDSKFDFKEVMGNIGSLGSQLGFDAQGLLEDIGSNLPGIDEAMSFAEVLRLCQTMNFSVVVFDTAPTGHTLRLLSFPTMMENTLGKIYGLKDKFSGLFNQLGPMLGMPEDMTGDQMQGKLEQSRKLIMDVNSQFKNPDLTTFVCVCIPEFLSVYETERLVQELTKFEIDTNTIVVNQVLFPEAGRPCALCNAREQMQSKYLEQLDILYSDFHIVKMPLMKHEIRGLDDLKEFSHYLTTPYEGPCQKAE